MTPGQLGAVAQDGTGRVETAVREPGRQIESNPAISLVRGGRERAVAIREAPIAGPSCVGNEALEWPGKSDPRSHRCATHEEPPSRNFRHVIPLSKSAPTSGSSRQTLDQIVQAEFHTARLARKHQQDFNEQRGVFPI